MNTVKLLLPSAIVVIAFSVVGVLVSPGAAIAESVHLHGGSKIEGEIVKRTDEKIFVDIGFTIVGIPVAQIREIEETTSEAKKSKNAEHAEAREVRHGIYFSASREPGTVKDKAEEVNSAVVKVVCPGKTGSGFIIHDVEGYVLTNFHVVEGDRDISVVIYEKRDGEVRRVKLDRVRIVALNPFLDLALLKIEDTTPAGQETDEKVRLEKVYLGEIESVKPGNNVFAIGSPLGIERTVSEGIVSNSSTAIGGLTFIQTTAAINPGNSGGPLFNEQGEVIGITSLKVMGAESLGFAIPINVVKDFVRNRASFAFDKDNANSGVRYFKPPRKTVTARSNPTKKF